MNAEAESTGKPYRILSLDGGGAKGMYTLGVLREVEALVGGPLYGHFDLIFGTSTGAIIASLLALGKSVSEIRELYLQHVPTVMKRKSRSAKTEALETLANDVFGDLKFDAVKTGVGVVATRWIEETPMIFKGNIAQAHGRKESFVPGFGCTIAEAVQASCSAYPFFDRKVVVTSQGNRVELLDGGYCANNPTLYAIADALRAVKASRGDLRVLSVGVGLYPKPRKGMFKSVIDRFWLVQLLQKTLEINTQSMEQLRSILYGDLQTVRISKSFTDPVMATDLFEHNRQKLDLLEQRGASSYAEDEQRIRTLLLG